ncbi:MAG: Radical SAM domain protein [Microgenomates bacterium 39_6]|nr:MAG: Radical SAM domain protein [Microgenomates bacterium 39_6]
MGLQTSTQEVFYVKNMIIKEIESQSLVTKSQLPEVDYVVNPYVGCGHGCVYCYARFMRRFTGHQEAWGEFVDVKINAGKLAEKELSRIGEKTVLLSSVTDPYQPLERKYQLTRRVLQQAVANHTPISILTKSNLVLRDLDLLSRLDYCEVGMSFSASEDNIRRVFEPRTSNVDQRLGALTKIKESGIRTYAFLGPILPGLTDLEDLFKHFARVKIDWVMVENLNVKGTIFPSLIDTVRQHYPRLVELYSQIKKNPRGYWDPVKTELFELANKYQLPVKLYFDH